MSSSSSVLVTTYPDPDIDGFACVVAYAEFLNKTGKAAVPGIFGRPHEEVMFVTRRFNLESPKLVAAGDFQRVVLVDMSNTYDLPPGIDPLAVIEIFDHRQATELESFKRAKSQIEMVGSCATLIFEKLRDANLAPSPSSAILLSAAIISNTLNFQSPLTTDRDRAAACELAAAACLPENFAREMFLAKSDLAGERLSRAIAGDYLYFVQGSNKVGIAQIEMIGADKLASTREAEALEALESLRKKDGLDFFFLSLLDLEDSYNIFITDHEPTRDLLQRVLGVKFLGAAGKRQGFIMRKQMVPLIKKALERE